MIPAYIPVNVRAARHAKEEYAACYRRQLAPIAEMIPAYVPSAQSLVRQA